MNVDEWANRVLAVTQGEAYVTKVVLQDTAGGVWSTWTEPFAIDRWLADVQEYLDGMIQDLPPQDVQLLFIAYGKDNTQVSQCTKVVRGRMKNANPALLGGPGRAMADGMQALAVTMEKVLQTANQQLDTTSKALATQHDLNAALMQALQFERMQALQQQPKVSPEILQQGMEMIPKLLELIFVDGRRAPGAANAVGSVAESVTDAVKN
jgi:hypothetical protein